MIPYAGVLETVGGWAPLVQQRVDWMRFVERYLDWRSGSLAAAWSSATIYAAWRSRRSVAHRAAERANSALFCMLAVAFLFGAQVAAIEFQRVPPFPRYFLPSLIPAALAVDVLTREVPRIRMTIAALSLVLLAGPSWSIVTQRRTNVDSVGTLLTQETEPGDLIVVSPWFLHPGFQRYYRGAADWVTVPVLPRSTMMRYDLIGAAIADSSSDAALSRCIDKAFSRGSRVWLLTQRQFRSDPGTRIPVRPGLSGPPRGDDYVRFRSYWEEGIEHRLRTCCTGDEQRTARMRTVWAEEDLLLIRWSPRPR
jgi:hypothetical protein